MDEEGKMIVHGSVAVEEVKKKISQNVERSVMLTYELMRKRLNMEYITFASFGHGTIQYFPYAPTEPTERPPIFANPQVEIAATLPEAEASIVPMDTLSDEDIRRLFREKQALKRKLEDEISELVDYVLKKKANTKSTNVPPYFNPQTSSTNVERDEMPDSISETTMLPVPNPKSSPPKACLTFVVSQFIPETSNTNVGHDEIPNPECEMAMQPIPIPHSSCPKQPSNERETLKQVCKLVPYSSRGSPQSYNAKEPEDDTNAKEIGQGDNDESGQNEVERCVTSIFPGHGR